MARRILHDLGYLGHFLHIHAGGRGGKQSVLVALYQSAGQLTQCELRKGTRISPAALSEVLTKLEVGGLIERRPCEQDRRRQLILLTPEGAVQARDMCQHRKEFEANALACLEPSEQAQLEEMLGRIVRHWKKMENEETCE